MKSFICLVWLMVISTSLIGQFTDNFTDSNFTVNPVWSGDVADYEIVNTAKELHLNAPAVSATKYLSTPSTAINNGSWEFVSRITVNPSGSNYTDIYLTASVANLTASLNGYFVRIGGTTDEVSLFKQTGTTKTKIIDGVDGTVSLNSNTVKVLVTRTAAGSWELNRDTSAGFTGYVTEGTITDLTHLTSAYFGVSCRFTSTRSDKFYFDDFVVTGTAPIDNTPPALDTVIVTSSTTLDIQFSEPVDITTAQTLTNYTANNGLGNPTVATRDASDFSLVHLTFGTAFQNGIQNNLTVTNMDDLAGNTLPSQGKPFIYVVPSTPVFRDVVINEVFPDPSPSIGLPGQEFVELYNTTTNKIFDLSGWILTGGSSNAVLGNYILLPGEYVIVASNSAVSDFIIYPNKMGVSSFPSLTNSGKSLSLRDNVGVDIDYMEYTINSYQDPDKDGGGWTIEQINPKLPCFNPANWRASNNSNGGTPGTQNSVYDTTPDVIAPSLVSVEVSSNTTLEVMFSEGVDVARFIPSNITVTGGRVVATVLPVGTAGNQFQLVLAPVLDTAIIYTITMDSLFDCSGNYAVQSANFVLANQPQAGDLIINEVLFNPFTGGADFVEVYNNSSKYIDLFGWSLSNDSLYGDSIKTHRVLYPNSYLVLTENPQNVQVNYITHNPNNFLQLPDLPTYSNSEGTVTLLYGIGQISDLFNYTDDYHFPLLKDEDGVSLERLDFNRATNDPGNWHSAAENVGFATPGVVNSQINPTAFTGEEIDITPEIFSPDNDGIDDILNITYKLDAAGFVGNINIYDVNGRKVKTLVDNVLLATEGVFTWDGVTDNATKARIGTYILFFEVFNDSGEVKSIKKTFVLAHKL